MMLWSLVSTIVMALSALLVTIYYFRNRQFEDVEDIKYQMFRQEEEE